MDGTDEKGGDSPPGDAEARYRAIIEMAVDGIITIDERGIIESVNPAAERLFGYTAAELVNRNVSMLMPAPYRAEHDSYLSNYIESGVAKIIGIGREVVGIRKDGTLFPAELAVSEVWLEKQRIFTGTVRDITQRRRTELLAEVGTLASGMAHEIGTPMNVILGRAEFVRGEIQDPRLARYLDVIIEQVERIARLMNQLLDLTRPHPLDLRPTDLNRVVESTLEVVQDRCRKRGVAVLTQLDPTLPRVEADRDRMGQVVLNLALNAIDAMAGGGTLRLTTSRHAPRSGGNGSIPQVELAVADTGAGIPPELLGKIFTPFFTTKEAGRGTGLGLSVVQGIVRDHRGEITVEGEVGKGTTFRVLLPVVAARGA